MTVHVESENPKNQVFKNSSFLILTFISDCIIELSEFFTLYHKFFGVGVKRWGLQRVIKSKNHTEYAYVRYYVGCENHE